MNKLRVQKGVFLLFILSVFAGGCERTQTLPAEQPEIVVEKFYRYISEAKLKGGGTPAREAFKLISAERSRLNEGQFLEVIRKYPPGFRVSVGDVNIHETQAIVTISYKMPSMFGDVYSVNSKIPLNIDEASNTWKIDFTGESYGMDKNSLNQFGNETGDVK
ncbi:MAG: hypothetical protein GY862_15640 [Gammaproteobacteria bacterium]|nr:hypothetical protein [Gammaproteobacteria bacterium]